MAKSKRPSRRAKATRKSAPRRKRAAARRSVKRPKATARTARKSAAKSLHKKKMAGRPKKAAAARPKAKAAAEPTKRPQLDRVRRRLEDEPSGLPSSLNMDRRGSAARTGRAELADTLRKHGSMTPGITGGDVDANFENAYFSGDEAPGGDNPTPDQEVVDDIGRALGVQYEDNEELKAADKLNERDKHRWELDPASSEDYKDRD